MPRKETLISVITVACLGILCHVTLIIKKTEIVQSDKISSYVAKQTVAKN